MSSEFPIRTIQVVGLTAAGVASGFSLGISFILTPRILDSPSPLLLKQWQNMYDQCKFLVPGTACVASLSYLMLSYHTYEKHANFLPNVWRSYLVASVLAFGMLPYTVIIMKSLNDKLMKKYQETKTLDIKDKIVEAGLGDETAHSMVDKWATLNLGRSLMLFSSTLLGAWTALA